MNTKNLVVSLGIIPIILIFIYSLVFTLQFVLADTVILQDADTENLDDTYIEADNPTSDRGNGQILYLLDRASSGYENEIILKFDISSMPPSATIDSATLSLYMYNEEIDTDESYRGDAHHVYSFPSFSINGLEWTEGNSNQPTGCADNELCWNERSISGEYNETAESSVTFTGPNPQIGWYSWDVTNMVRSDYDSGNDNVSIWIRAVHIGGDPGEGDYVQFRSKEYTSDPSLNPKLEITYSVLNDNSIPYLEVDKFVYPEEINICEQATITLNITGVGNITHLPVDVMLIIDRSGSMGDPISKLNGAKDAAKTFVDQLDSMNDRSGLVSYSSTATLDQGLTDNQTLMKNKIDALSVTLYGRTNIGDGVYYATEEILKNGRTASVIWVEILLSDGRANEPFNDPGHIKDREYAINASINASDENIVIYTIGLGEDANKTHLEEMANITGGKFYYAPNSSVLESIYLEIAGELFKIAAQNIIVTDILKPHVILDETSLPTNCTYFPNNHSINCILGTLEIAETKIISFNITVNQTGNNLINVYPDSGVSYIDINENPAFIEFSMTYLNVLPCDDGLWCNGLETCVDNECVPGTPVDCSHLDDQCNDGVCDEDLDACVQDPKPVSTPCDNGLYCDGDDHCDGFGACVDLGSPIDCSHLDDQCNIGVCDEEDDRCEYDPFTTSTPCDVDEDLCTIDHCDSSNADETTPAVCVQYDEVICPDDTECRDYAACDPNTGTCPYTDMPFSTLCEADDQFCTADHCDGSGNCVYWKPYDCSDGVFCTVDTCDEINDRCVNTPDDDYCDDGLWCNGEEWCHPTLDCQPGTPIDCSGYNLPEIGTCDYNPDNYHYTWDYAPGFTSVCDEVNDECTQGSYTFTHTCADNDLFDTIPLGGCDAECDENPDCPPNSCSETYYDSCIGKKLKDYNGNKIKDSKTVTDDCDNTCQSDCTCTDCPVSCPEPSAVVDCVKDVCEAECDSDDDCETGGCNPDCTCACVAITMQPHMISRVLTVDGINIFNYRNGQYAFTGEKLEYYILARDSKGAVHIQGARWVIDEDGPGNDRDWEEEALCNEVTGEELEDWLRENEDRIKQLTNLAYDEFTDKIFHCLLTIEPFYEGQSYITVQVKDIMNCTAEIPYETWIFNPPLKVEIGINNDDNEIIFNERQEGTAFRVQPNCERNIDKSINPRNCPLYAFGEWFMDEAEECDVSFSQNKLIIKNPALIDDEPNPISLWLFIAGSNFYATDSLAKCPYTNQLQIEQFEYRAISGTHDSHWRIMPEYSENDFCSGPTLLDSCMGGCRISTGNPIDTLPPSNWVELQLKIVWPMPCIGVFNKGEMYIIIKAV